MQTLVDPPKMIADGAALESLIQTMGTKTSCLCSSRNGDLSRLNGTSQMTISVCWKVLGPEVVRLGRETIVSRLYCSWGLVGEFKRIMCSLDGLLFLNFFIQVGRGTFFHNSKSHHSYVLCKSCSSVSGAVCCTYEQMYKTTRQNGRNAENISGGRSCKSVPMKKPLIPILQIACSNVIVTRRHISIPGRRVRPRLHTECVK